MIIKEKPMPTSEEKLKNIINYNGLPPAPDFLKPGICFDSADYTLPSSLEMTRDTITLLENHVVMRHIVLQDEINTIFYYLIVSSNSCNEAREQTISLIADMTMMTMDMFSLGPSDIGELSIVPIHPEKKVGNLIFFVRNNIGVAILVREGDIDVAGLSKQIDRYIKATKDYDSKALRSITPHISKIAAPDEEIILNEKFKLSIVIDQKSGQNDMLYIFQYDDEMVYIESEDGPHAVFEAVMPGKTIINCTAVNRKDLLSTSKSIEINIIDK